MQKFGVVKVGVTPSCISGKVSSKIVRGNAVASLEEENNLLPEDMIKFDEDIKKESSDIMKDKEGK